MNVGVLRRVDGLEIVPGREVADERRCVEAGELFLADRKRDDRNVFGRDARVAELLVERHVGVAVDGGDDGGLLAGRAERLDVGDDRLPVGMTERRVVDHDVFRRDALRSEVRFEDLVGRARIDVVGAGEHPAFHAFLVHQIVDRGNGLLVRRGAGVEDVLGALLALVLDGIEEQRIQLLEDRQHGFPRHRGPAAERRRDPVTG